MGEQIVAHIISVYAYAARIKTYTAMSANDLGENSMLEGAMKQAERSASAEVRNPLLKLKAANALKALPPEVRAALRGVLLELRAEAHAKAEASWKARKGPMAVYFRAVAVYAGHIARLLRDEKQRVLQ